MNTVVTTQSLLGQPLEVVQTYLGPSINHQYSAEKQTDFYLHRSQYLKDVFPIVLTGIISVYRKNRCIALRAILNKRDTRYDSFVYNREIATRLFEKVVSNDYAYWHQIEAEPKADNKIHYVYCMGGNVATTWDVSTIDGTIEGDVIIYLDSRCGETDHSVVNQPIVGSTQDAGSRTATPAIDGGLGQGAVQPIPIRAFPDIDGNPYEVEILKAANVYRFLAGYEDGTFRPDVGITREQGISLLIEAMKLLVVDPSAIAFPDELVNPPFADVSTTHRSAKQFYYAKQAGILAGDGQDKAYPDARLDRAGLIAIIRNGLQAVVNENYSASADLGERVEVIDPDISFSDISGHWAESAIQELGTYGIATPLNEQGKAFAPNEEAHRDYLAAALVRMVEVKFNQMPGIETKPAPVKSFPDIGKDPYKEEIIKAANRYNIVMGYADGKFHPTDYLSREQAVTMLINAMQNMLPPEAIEIPETLSDPPPFEDVTAGDNATKIQYAKEANLVSGDERGFFRPMDKLSRAGLIAMIHNGLSYVVAHQFGREVSLKDALVPLENPPSEFSDMPKDHWACALVDDLLQVGIAVPYGDSETTFKPDQFAERNYAAAAMVRMVETEFSKEISSKPSEPTSPFSDVEGNPYQRQIELAASQYKLVSGYEDGTFRPNSPISREQAVSILIDALQQRVANKGAVVIPDSLMQPPFSDVSIERWSAPKLYFAKQAGIIAGDEAGRFYPEAQLGRAQLMAIAYQALAYAVWADFGSQISLDTIFEPGGAIDTYSFDDIPDSHWAAGIMPVMSILGLAQPADFDEPTKFAPDSLAHRDYTVATGVHMLQLMYTRIPEVTDETRFMDVVGDPFAEEISRAANQYHIVSGGEDGYFRPLESVHREHLVAMLVDALKHLVNDPSVIKMPGTLAEAPFRDVPADSLFAPKIKFVSDVGIMSGDKGTGLFRPKNDLTRAELMAVISNALQFVVKNNYGEGVDLESVIDTDRKTTPTFTDIPDSHWGKSAIALMAELGIALPREQGSDRFLPDEPSRRNYAAASMVNMIETPFRESSAPADNDSNGLSSLEDYLS